ncbi:Helix-turn-helix domai [Burkholderia cepacia]|nr:Helix-turn-helix domai [Burkholderia cepacia]
MHNLSSFNHIIDNWPDNTASHQRARLLEAMRARGGVTTLEAMRFLDIVDPRARIVELRKEGYSIHTSWVHQPSECGRLHAVGLYTLMGNVAGTAKVFFGEDARPFNPQPMPAPTELAQPDVLKELHAAGHEGITEENLYSLFNKFSGRPDVK